MNTSVVRPAKAGRTTHRAGLSSSCSRRHNNRGRLREVTSFLLCDRSMNFDVLNYIDVSTSVNMRNGILLYTFVRRSSRYRGRR